MTVANAAIVHSLPGRIRLRLQERYGGSACLSALCGQISGFCNVRSVKANPATRSIVIEFSDVLENLVQQLQQHGVLVDNEGMSGRQWPGIDSGKRRKGPINLVSGRNINGMFMIGSMLAAVGIVQACRGRITVPAISAFWYAAQAYRRSMKESQ